MAKARKYTEAQTNVKKNALPWALALLAALLLAPATFQEGLVAPGAGWGRPLLAAAAMFASLCLLVLCCLVGWRRAKRSSAGQQGEAGAGSEEGAILPEDEAAPTDGLDAALKDAGMKQDPENLMDLARAFQEMGKDDQALEALARVVERDGGARAGEIAATLRRIRANSPRDP